jgi:hypothetical protein
MICRTWRVLVHGICAAISQVGEIWSGFRIEMVQSCKYLAYPAEMPRNRPGVRPIMISGRWFHMIDMVTAENMIRLEWYNCLNTSNDTQVIEGHLKRHPPV